MIACCDGNVLWLLWSCGGVNSTLGLGGGHPLHAVQKPDYVVAVLASTGQPLAGVAARCCFSQGNGNLNSSVSSQTAATSRQLPPRVFERRPTSLASRFEFIFLGMAWRSPKAQTASYWAADRICAVRAK